MFHYNPSIFGVSLFLETPIYRLKLKTSQDRLKIVSTTVPVFVSVNFGRFHWLFVNLSDGTNPQKHILQVGMVAEAFAVVGHHHRSLVGDPVIGGWWSWTWPLDFLNLKCDCEYTHLPCIMSVVCFWFPCSCAGYIEQILLKAGRVGW